MDHGSKQGTGKMIAGSPAPAVISPQAAALWMTLRRALLLMVAGIENYLGMPRRK